MKAPILEPSAAEQSQMKYDSTGMYHWCPSRNINDCLMDRQEAAMTILQVSFDFPGKCINNIDLTFRIM